MCGPDTLKTLDLGDKFDTSKVVDMGAMFMSCGKNTLETLNLGGKFKINVNLIKGNMMLAKCGDNTLKEIIYEDTIENFEKNCIQLVTQINDYEDIKARPIIKCTDGNYEY